MSYVGDHAADGKHDTENRDCEEMIIIVLQAVDDTDNTVGEVEEVEDKWTVIKEYFSHWMSSFHDMGPIDASVLICLIRLTVSSAVNVQNTFA